MVKDKDGMILSLTEPQLRAYKENQGKTVLPRQDEEQIIGELFYKIRGYYPGEKQITENK
jgi:hypothetical protein